MKKAIMTTQEFIEKANQIHHHKYDYSNTVYVNSRTKIQFVCPIHGIVKQNPKAHLKSCGCPSCASNKMTTKEFISKAKIVHKNKYDYSKTVYMDQRSRLTIVCKIHGPFIQLARAHLAGQGCPKCSLQSPKRYKKDLNHFIEKSRRIHGNKYDYSETEYLSANKSLIIICPVHGRFKQRASAHTAGQGCPKCGQSKPISHNEFIAKAQIIHNDKYDYSKVKYTNSFSKIEIICPRHGCFLQMPYQHLNGQGCPQCGHKSMQNKLSSNEKEFVAKARQIHGDKYDYSKVKYTNRITKVQINCPKHGGFDQKPNDHLSGSGCPFCAGTNLQKEIFEFVSLYCSAYLNDRSIIKPYEIDIYVPSHKIAIEVNGLYWHSYNRTDIEDKMRHYHKCDLCLKQGIQLLQINENEWLEQKDVVKSIIKAKLGLFDNKIFARKCDVVFVDKNIHNSFMSNAHIQGPKGHTIALGLQHDGNIVSIMSFCKHPKYQWEIARFANSRNTIVVGGASRLFKHFVSECNPDSVMTYADRRYSNGNLYKELGFAEDGISKPNYCYIKRNIVHSRQQFQKHKLHRKLEIFDPNLTEAENMFLNGYRRMWDAGHYRFLWHK